jgi:hypothetical protein
MTIRFPEVPSGGRRMTNVLQYWLTVVLGALEASAFGLGLAICGAPTRSAVELYRLSAGAICMAA